MKVDENILDMDPASTLSEQTSVEEKNVADEEEIVSEENGPSVCQDFALQLRKTTIIRSIELLQMSACGPPYRSL
jgi:hypothetical protein